jgi:septum formation protein
MKIILASTSPIRKQMLSKAGIKFEVISPICDEDIIKAQLSHLNMSDLARELAKAKAKSVSDLMPKCYVIGSDQVCEFEGRAISKSKTKDEAFQCLKAFSGKLHIQNNGTCIYYNGECVMEFKDKAELTMKPLSDAEIWKYIEKDSPLGCAGSYKYELNGKYLFNNVIGSAECIQGFSLSKVIDFFSKVVI